MVTFNISPFTHKPYAVFGGYDLDSISKNESDIMWVPLSSFEYWTVKM